MKAYEILGLKGEILGMITAENVKWINEGIDFQPNIFNGYHAVEFGVSDPPGVLNLPAGMTIREKANANNASSDQGR